jgi:hypothetical protein
LFAERTLDEKTELDRCIDDLLKGREWAVTFPPGRKRSDVEGLMQVAELLVLTAREAPRDGREQKERVWTRIRGMLYIRGLLASLSPARLVTGHAWAAWPSRSGRLTPGDWPEWPSAIQRRGKSVGAVN